MLKVVTAATACFFALVAPGWSEQSGSASRESFYVGGTYTGPASAQVMRGQMYVEVLTPEHVTHPYPLVLIHGLAQTSMNWLTTPDGRSGWASWFVDHGWKVVMVDQPTRGRSAWQPSFDKELKSIPASFIEHYFTAPEQWNDWPQAKLHTQWPGGPNKGHVGDSIFDQFYASQMASVDNVESEKLMQLAGTALLDRIGPAILVVHSQAGLFGWLLADARPASVKGIVAIEPAGPPFRDNLTGSERPWGLTDLPLMYEPPLAAGERLEFEQESKPDAPDLIACWHQKGAPRTLPHLAAVRVLLVTSEASYHAPYDHCTVDYLAQAGVPVEFARLGEHGIHGNAHMMMVERNNLEIANFLHSWLVKNFP